MQTRKTSGQLQFEEQNSVHADNNAQITRAPRVTEKEMAETNNNKKEYSLIFDRLPPQYTKMLQSVPRFVHIRALVAQ